MSSIFHWDADLFLSRRRHLANLRSPENQGASFNGVPFSGQNLKPVRKEISLLVLLLLGAALSVPVWAQATAASPAATTTESAPPSPWAKCLPPAIKLSDVVEVIRAGATAAQPAPSQIVTVAQKLEALAATCSPEHKLVDRNGRPIVFYHLQGCWGMPPPGYQEILQKQRRELERLQQEHTVIEMTCNPSGTRIP